MVHLCSTTQSPHLREAVITAIMSQYPADGPMEYPEPMMYKNDEAYCKEVWWPIIGHIVQLYEEQIGDRAIHIFGPSLLLWTVNSQFISLPLSMQRRWLSFLSSLEGLVCRSHSEHMIKAYLVCCTASVSESYGGDRRMLALVAVLQTHHLKLEPSWLDGIADSLSVSARISTAGQIFRDTGNWDRESGKPFCEPLVTCFDPTPGAEFIGRMQRFCNELQDVHDLTVTQTRKYQRLLDFLAQLVCQVALAMEPKPCEHVPEDLKSFLVALQGVHKIWPPYPSYRIEGSCTTALVFVARHEPDLFPKPFARAMVRHIEGSRLLAVAQAYVTGLDLDGVDMNMLGTSWSHRLDARSRGVIERLIEPQPFAKILDIYEHDVRGAGGA
jgi:hypothetical protein